MCGGGYEGKEGRDGGGIQSRFCYESGPVVVVVVVVVRQVVVAWMENFNFVRSSMQMCLVCDYYY